jgi:hypothetical protein
MWNILHPKLASMFSVPCIITLLIRKPEDTKEQHIQWENFFFLSFLLCYGLVLFSPTKVPPFFWLRMRMRVAKRSPVLPRPT